MLGVSADLMLLVCKLPCLRVSSAFPDHYHCPLCGHIDARKAEMANHLQVCNGLGVHFLLKQNTVNGKCTSKRVQKMPNSNSPSSLQVATKNTAKVCVVCLTDIVQSFHCCEVTINFYSLQKDSCSSS